VKALARRVVPRRWRPALRRLYWRGGRHRCPVCDARVRRYLAEGYDLPVLRELDVVGGEHWPERACPVCFTNTRTRLAWFYLARESGVLEDFTRLLHVAPEMGVHWRLSAARSVDYHPCDLSPEQYGFANDLRRIDLTNLPYPDASFDVVLANHVLEHVADDARALAEIHRVLRPGGWAMLQVPIAHKLEHTREDASVTSPCERERLFGQRDHVRLYGRNYPDRLARAGFSVELWDGHTRAGGNACETWLLNPREALAIVTPTTDAPAEPGARKC
jgi:predicted SAM-dependent methyltransferase